MFIISLIIMLEEFLHTKVWAFLSGQWKIHDVLKLNLFIKTSKSEVSEATGSGCYFQEAVSG
jgi:hypothetical protein